MKILARSGELLNGLIGVDGPGLRLFVLNVTMYLISFLMVIARLCTRKHYRQMGADDYIMMAAMVSLYLEAFKWLIILHLLSMLITWCSSLLSFLLSSIA